MDNIYKTPLWMTIKKIKNKLKITNTKETVTFKAVNPDIRSSLYNGNSITVNNEDVIYRGYKSWLDLAQVLNCRMLTPEKIDDNFVLIRYEKLNEDSSFHKNIVDKEEKYGENSIFSKIHKNEETAFIHYYMQALENVKIETRIRILNLGVNSGDEFEAIQALSKNFENQELIGIDYCSSAINAAKEKFKRSSNISFYTHDINKLDELELGKFDLIISIGTLQSSNLEFNKLLMNIVQNQLKRSGAIILGFPNCRWIDGEMIYGARVKNYPFSEMGLLYKDVIFSKKYMQQKKFRVTVTGKDYIFLTATSISTTKQNH
ncbi:methyltransferase domain-containing protein [Sulfurimonas sp.]|uniref:class I SAM-dependent methyltransferase n=1 Tax=Sulfurimonas sp. TaxID=2022749 RepID=UPI00260D361F|nr:methyltransferase domain-containing protein [Sulfurimonas sp.]